MDKTKKSKQKIVRNIVIGAAIVIAAQSVFIGWRYSFGPFATLGNLRLRGLAGNGDAYCFDTLQPMENSPLAGKNVLFLGSSVTNGRCALYQSIPEYMAARLSCTATKRAVDGTTLTDNGKNSYVQRLLHQVEPASPYDLVVVQLSTNDASKELPLGEISADGSYDTKTITGAMESIIDYVKTTWDCPVAFYTNAKFDSVAYEAMVQRLYALQKVHAIGVLDLWSSSDFNAITLAQRGIYMYDKIHPTAAGYRDWWGPELERQLCAFLATAQ